MTSQLRKALFSEAVGMFTDDIDLLSLSMDYDRFCVGFVFLQENESHFAHCQESFSTIQQHGESPATA